MYVYAYAVSTNIAGTAPEIIDKIVSSRAAYICEQLHEKANKMKCVQRTRRSFRLYAQSDQSLRGPSKWTI